MNVQSIKEARAAKTDAVRALVAKATTEKRDLSGEEQAAFDTIKQEIEKLEGDLKRAEFIAELERRTEGTPVGTGDNRFDAELGKFSLQRAILSQIPGHTVDCARERELSAELSKRAGRPFQGIAVPMSVFREPIERRSPADPITTGLPAAGPGSNLIATDFRGDLFIDRLWSSVVVRRLGARVLTNLIGNVDIPKLKQSASVGWVAENSPLTPSDQQYAKVQLSPKHAGGVIELSRNMLLQTASPDIETLVRNDFASLMARGIISLRSSVAAAMSPSASWATATLITASASLHQHGQPCLTLSAKSKTSMRKAMHSSRRSLLFANCARPARLTAPTASW